MCRAGRQKEQTVLSREDETMMAPRKDKTSEFRLGPGEQLDSVSVARGWCQQYRVDVSRQRHTCCRILV